MKTIEEYYLKASEINAATEKARRVKYDEQAQAAAKFQTQQDFESEFLKDFEAKFQPIHLIDKEFTMRLSHRPWDLATVGVFLSQGVFPLAHNISSGFRRTQEGDKIKICRIELHEINYHYADGVKVYTHPTWKLIGNYIMKSTGEYSKAEISTLYVDLGEEKS